LKAQGTKAKKRQMGLHQTKMVLQQQNHFKTGQRDNLQKGRKYLQTGLLDKGVNIQKILEQHSSKKTTRLKIGQRTQILLFFNHSMTKKRYLLAKYGP
jgi:hypothetical protein